MLIAEWILDGVVIYSILGFVFAVIFTIVGPVRHWFGHDVQEGSWLFRVITFPSVIALWPVLLKRGLGARHRGAPRYTWVGSATQRATQVLMWAILLLIVPTVLVVAGLAKVHEPISDFPVKEKLVPAALNQVVELGELKVDGKSLITHVLADGAGTSRQLELRSDVALDQPALCVYWSPSNSGPELPRDAVFLGGFWGGEPLRYRLPEEAKTAKGSVFLVSQIHGSEIVASCNLAAVENH